MDALDRDRTMCVGSGGRPRRRARIEASPYGEAVPELRSEWTDIEGLRLHARVGGAGADRVVLVHGIAVSSRYMIPLARELAGAVGVAAVDLPGFGRSARPRRALSVRELGRTLAAWLDANGVAQPLLVGNSFGCQVVVDLAAREPSRARGLVLIGPTTDAANRSAPNQIARWAVSPLVERPSLPPIVALDATVAGPRRIWSTFRASLRDPIEDKVTAIEVPILVLRGANDPLAPQPWVEHLVARMRRGRLAVIPGGGHALNHSRPAEVAAAVRIHLAATSS